MDLRALEAPPSDAERAAVDALLGPPPAVDVPVPLSQVKQRRTHLLPALIALQSQVGWVSPGGLGYACRRLGVPPAEGFGVASFYALLSVEERPRAFAHVCDDIACHAAGAERLCAQMAKQHGPASHAANKTTPYVPSGVEGHLGHSPPTAHGAVTPGVSSVKAPLDSARGERGFRWARSPCLGLCEQAPAALVTLAGPTPIEQSFGAATLEKIDAALKGDSVAAVTPRLENLGPRKLLARAGTVNPSSLDDYRARGGYEALRRALELGPEGVIREVTDAKLVGRGGAAFPTGRMWEAVSRAPVRPHYVVCNADESEPGTFKDRVLLEHDPFGIIEAMTIAGYATGSERGYLYLRGEYPLAHARLAHALSAARARGLLGAHILGRGFHFDIELRSGAGAYICGEETALFNSIEGFRGEPRNKPPFPVQSGLFGKPTAINNVETLAAALDIVRDGAASYTSTRNARFTRNQALLPLGSKIAKPGVYEVPFGTKLVRVARARGRSPQPERRSKRDSARWRCRPLHRPREARRAHSPSKPRESRRPGALGSGVVMVLDEERRPRCRCSTASPRSSATSHAASACRVAWAPCVRKNCWRG